MGSNLFLHRFQKASLFNPSVDYTDTSALKLHELDIYHILHTKRKNCLSAAVPLKAGKVTTCLPNKYEQPPQDVAWTVQAHLLKLP